MLNRSVLIVRPKQPYLDWAAGLDNTGLVPDAEGEQTVYLVPEIEDDEHADRVLRRVYAVIFERELFGWHTDETAWPKNRTFSMFRKWFKIEMHSVVEDICDFRLVDDEA